MITFSEKLFIGKEVRKNAGKVMSKIEKHEFQTGTYVIILAVNGRDIFDLIPAWQLSEEGYHGRDIEILGIASGEDEAKRLAAMMIKTVLNETGNVNVREYFS